MPTQAAKQPTTLPTLTAVDAAALLVIYAWRDAVKQNTWSGWMNAAAEIGGAASLASLMSESEAAADLHCCTLLAVERAALVREGA